MPERVFLQVLRLSVLAGPLFAAIVLMRLALRRAPKWISCALWGLLALRLVCPFSLPSPLSLQPSEAKVDQVVADMTRSQNAPSGAPGYRGADIVEGRADADAAQPPVPVRPEQNAAGTVPQPETSAPAPSSWAGPLSSLWLAGASAMVLYGAGSYLRLRRRVRTAVRWKENLWQCETVDAPFVLGVVKPRVYLPFYMDPIAAAQVIAHERAHIRRHDQITKVFAWLLLSAYWFDPLVWAAYALLCRDVELACDERVVRDMSTEARQRYARALLNWGVDKPNLAACPLAFGEVGLKERIKTVMKYKKPARWAAVLAVALIAASGACLMTSPVAEAVTPAQSAPFLDAAENETPPAPDAGQTTAAPTAVLDPDAVPDPIPILTVRPRDVTAEEAKALAEAIFSGTDIYEDNGLSRQDIAPAVERAEKELENAQASGDSRYIDEAAATLDDLRMQYDAAPEALERTVCTWAFRPTSQDVETGDMSIRARAELDGMLYIIRVRNCEPFVAVSGQDIHSLDIDLTSDGVLPDSSPDAPTPAEIDAMIAKVNGWLEQAGMEDHAVVSAGETDGCVTITVRPLYGGVAPLPCEGRLTDGRELPSLEEMYFLFDHDTLICARCSMPVETVASQPQETLMGLRAALAAAGLEDAPVELDWQFGYAPVPTGNGTFLLVPAYRHGSADADGTCEVIVSAADGTLLADTRPGSEQPGVTPTPAPAVAEIEVRWGRGGPIDYVESGWFSLPSGQSIDLYAIWYPQVISATPEWTVDDESIVTVQPDETGIRCHCELTGASGTETVLHVRVNEKQEDIRIIVA